MSEPTAFKRYTVTSALPYANGPIHIGHLAGVYVPADIYVRYLRSKGEDVLFIGGSDEHGVPITIRARKEGLTPQQVVDKYHEIIRKSFEELGISFDVYIGDWVFNLHDRASLTQETYENPTTVKDSANTEHLQNNVGVSGLWDLNKAVLSVGYDHADYISLNTTTTGQPDSASENFYLNAGIRPREEYLIGLEGGFGFVFYDQSGATNSASSLPTRASGISTDMTSPGAA